MVCLALGLAACGGSTTPARQPTPPITKPAAAATTPPGPTTTSVPTEGIGAVAFFDAHRGYGLFVERDGASCSLAVASTTDGGTTFSKRVTVTSSDPPATWCFSSSMSFDPSGDGFVVGPGLFVTHDGGATWTDTHPPGPVLSVVPLGRSVWRLDASCANTDSATLCDLHVAVSSDGGRTWATTPGALPQTPVMSVMANTWLVRTSLSSAYVVIPSPASGSAPTRLFATADGGRSWQERPSPCPLGGTLVSLLSEAPGGTLWFAWAGQPGAGNQLKTVVRSGDGGQTWQGGQCTSGNTSSYPQALISDGISGGYLGGLVATSATTALIDGDRNTVRLTTDGGSTWIIPDPRIGGQDNGSGGLFFANSQDGWAASLEYRSAGSLWRTTNGGRSWSQAWPS
jgi:photosystem II stability/assembly factor-like uncharacterized protein